MISVVGLGPAGLDSVSLAARDALRAARTLLLRTAVHPAADDLRAQGVAFESFDELYDAAPDFDALYTTIVDHVLERAAAGDVTYAVPGNPLVAEETVRRLIARAREAGLPIRIVSSASFLEPALAALGFSVSDGLFLVDALALDHVVPRPDVDLLLYQVYDRDVASAVKLALMEVYPDDWEVSVVCRAGVAGAETVVRTPLFRLDRVEVDHLTVVYVPALPKERRKTTFADLVGVMTRLRGEGGCPWDRKQDHATLKRYMIEECYEAIEAIDAGDMDALCEELGDVLLQVVFHAEIEREAAGFDISDVLEHIVSKLIRRHPHVFGDVTVSGAEEVLTNWEKIKRSEKDASWRPSLLDGVPCGMPALMRAMEISKRAAKVGFEWEKLEDVFAKLDEEVGELREAVAGGQHDQIASEVGDLLFTIVNVARWRKVDPEDALRVMLARFYRRFRHIETRAQAAGKELSEMSLEEMDALWDEAKRMS